MSSHRRSAQDRAQFWQDLLCLCVVGWVFSSLALSCSASDHADPLFNRQQEGGITDLFAFVQEDSQLLTVIACVRRALIEDETLQLEPYTYRVFLDLDSKISFDNRDGSLARYGGRVVNPREIAPEITFSIRLNNQPQTNTFLGFTENECACLDRTMVRTVEATGLKESQFRIWSGVRDDPFIFYRFSNTNCVGIVIDIPLEYLPVHQLDFLIWATSSKRGNQIDHVGRSLRTMLPRLDFLNSLPPAEHVDAIHERDERPGVVADVLAVAVPPLFGIHSYDYAPDVMILTRRTDILLNGQQYGNSYPNGRRLTDDVAKLCCEQGDCLLYEVSLAEAHHDGRPRPSHNNVPFLDTYPYLADPVANPTALEDPRLSSRTKWLLGLLFAVLLAFQALLIYYTIRFFRLRYELRVRDLA